MKKSEMQKTVDRILRALYPFPVERRKKILAIVENYVDEEFQVGEDDEEDEVTPDMEMSPEERRAAEAS